MGGIMEIYEEFWKILYAKLFKLTVLMMFLATIIVVMDLRVEIIKLRKIDIRIINEDKELNACVRRYFEEVEE